MNIYDLLSNGNFWIRGNLTKLYVHWMEETKEYYYEVLTSSRGEYKRLYFGNDESAAIDLFKTNEES